MQKQSQITNKKNTSKNKSVEVFSLGEPIPVLDKLDILNYLESPLINQKYYSPPIELSALAKAYHSTAHHASAIQVKKNILLSSCKTSPLLARSELDKFILDYLVFGNAYFEVVFNKLNQPLKLIALKAKYIRKGIAPGQYYQISDWQHEHEFKPDSIFHLYQPDINQEIYGLPEYLSSLQSAFLNESATLFRRKYYLNGAHAGSIIYMSDEIINEADKEQFKQQLRNARGTGNFKNLVVYAPNGKEKGIQVIPLSDVVAKDEFLNIKNTSRDDVLAAHRVPPQLMGIIPNNTGGFGDVEKAGKVFFINEIKPLRQRLSELNEWMAQFTNCVKPPLIEFIEYELLDKQ